MPSSACSCVPCPASQSVYVAGPPGGSPEGVPGGWREQGLLVVQHHQQQGRWSANRQSYFAGLSSKKKLKRLDFLTE